MYGSPIARLRVLTNLHFENSRHKFNFLDQTKTNNKISCAVPGPAGPPTSRLSSVCVALAGLYQMPWCSRSNPERGNPDNDTAPQSAVKRRYCDASLLMRTRRKRRGLSNEVEVPLSLENASRESVVCLAWPLVPYHWPRRPDISWAGVWEVRSCTSCHDLGPIQFLTIRWTINISGCDTTYFNIFISRY